MAKKKKDGVSWDEIFMSMAFHFALKSKDKSTKVGAVIVGKSNGVVTLGFNGHARGVKEKKERTIRPLKYLFCEHAERNAIYNAAKLGSATDQCRMYTQFCPCADCARGIIQAGITELIISNKLDGILDASPDWKVSCSVAKQMLKEAKVKLRVYDGPLTTEIDSLCSGRRIKL